MDHWTKWGKYDEVIKLLSDTDFSTEQLETFAFVVEKKIIWNELQKAKMLEQL